MFEWQTPLAHAKLTIYIYIYIYSDLMFFWLYIMNWLYINYQLDALIIIYS